MQLKPLVLRLKRLISEVSLTTISTLSIVHATTIYWGLKALGEDGVRMKMRTRLWRRTVRKLDGLTQYMKDC